MKYNEFCILSTLDKLDYFLKTLTPSNRTPDYYINWEKVVKNTNKYELELNTLNYLIGKENIEEEALKLFKNQPNLLKVVPTLIASRDLKLDVLNIDDHFYMKYDQINFKDIDVNDIEFYIGFIEKTGLFSFLQNKANRSLVDYVYGVEAGLDSNARKNRSGKIMENILANKLFNISEEENSTIVFKEQAKPNAIKNEWGIDVPVDKSNRSFDIAAYNTKTNKLFLFETNYYGGGGSKLKSVAGEFQTLKKLIDTAPEDIEFIWVTDGQGWHTAKNPMEESFGVIGNIFNLQMIEDGYLEEILNKK